MSPEYNLSPTAGNTLGVKLSEEAKKKIGEKAKLRGPYPKEVYERVAAQTRGRKYPGRVRSQEAIAKTAEKNRGKKRSLEFVASRTGKKATAEHCKNISKALKGKAKSPEHVAKMRAASTGKNPSDVSRLKMSESHKSRWTPKLRAEQAIAQTGRVHSEETKKKQAIARALYWQRKRNELTQTPAGQAPAGQSFAK